MQPGVTAFGDVSSFQLVAKARGPVCRRGPGAETARIEGHGAAVLCVLPQGLRAGWKSPAAGDHLRLRVTSRNFMMQFEYRCREASQ